MNRRRKAPTKTELLQLQKLYKTDEKIGERLGGVPAYLVAYWRRKKNIPKHSLPKFSETEVRNLWERYGDDEKAGLELGLSKAAFYNWRRRYGIKEKPAFLKLEQLEFNFPGAKLGPTANSLYSKQTVAQKIIVRCLQEEQEQVDVGDDVRIEPDLVVSHGDTAGIVNEFKSAGVEYVWNPNKIVISYDCLGSRVDPRAMRDFVKRQRIKSEYDFRDGLCHQVILEKGHVLPGQLALGTDRMCAAYGCVGMYSVTVPSVSVCDIWISGAHTLRVPETIRIGISGRKGRAVYAKDIILSIIRKLKSDGASDRVIEYGGSIVSQMTISERFLLSSLSTEMGAAAAICPYDATTRRYLTGRSTGSFKPVIPDKNAEYFEAYQISVDQLTPLIAMPSSVDEVKPVAEVEGVPIQLIVLGTLTSGRYDDLRVAADILKGKKVHADCRLVIIPASRSVYLEALNKGLVRVLVEAGAVMGSLSGGGAAMLGDLLAPGEKCLATAGSLCREKMTQPDTEIYLCSPATAAASALNGAITDPTRYVR
jgi:3-isopropylmalate/(R)-2-methylmalate dehydratase large subunit